MKSVGIRARCALSLLLSFLLTIPSSPAFSFAGRDDLPKRQIDNFSGNSKEDLSTNRDILSAQSNYPQGSKAGDWRTVVSSDRGSQTGPLPVEQPPPESSPPAFDEPGEIEEPIKPPAPEPSGNIPEPEPSDVFPSQPRETAEVEVGLQGGQVPWKQGCVSLTIPPGALNQSVSITVQKADVKIERDPESNIGADDILEAATVELGPSGTTFAAPVEVSMKISPESRRRLSQGGQLAIIVDSGGFLEEVTDYKIDDQGQVRFRLEHFSSIAAIVVGGMLFVALMGMAGRYTVTDSPHILIQPDNPDVQRFVHSGKVKLPTTINPRGPTDLGIEKTFKGTMGVFKCVNGGATMVNLKDGSKINCQDLTFLAASVLLGSKNSRFSEVKAVGGSATCGEYSGGHMWLEVKIDGKVYVVDTSNPKRLMLIPAAEAYAQYILEPAFEFGHNSRKKSYVGWDGKPGPDNFEDASSLPAPTPEQLKQMYKDGDEMGCRHMSQNTESIKAELQEVYGKIQHPSLKLKFREGYQAGAERCRPK